MRDKTDPVRQIILDTETTGLEPGEGHRIIEIGCLEMSERRLTGRDYHVYLNPEREVDEGALEVHGITNAFLADKPRFADIVGDFLDFVHGAELVIHNAAFDVGFVNAELRRIGPDRRLEDHARILDTLALARELHPGQRVSLDALCKRYDVDNSGRDLHGALLDAELLAEVYLAMTGGQVDLVLEADAPEAGSACDIGGIDPARLIIQRPSESERAAHRQRLDAIRESAGCCIWLDQLPP